MREHNNQRGGLSYLELIIATALLAIIIGIALAFAGGMLKSSNTQFNKVAIESRLNRAVKQIIENFAESNGSLVTVITYGQYSAVIFPTPRDKSGHFSSYTTNEDGEIVSIATRPQWQGYIIIWADPLSRKLYLVRDYRSTTFSCRPTFPYPEEEFDFEAEEQTSTFTYSDGVEEWEIGKGKGIVLAGDVECFKVTLQGNGNLSLLVSAAKTVGNNGGGSSSGNRVVVRYQDAVTGRNTN